jgi:ATP-dependent helicase HrpB
MSAKACEGLPIEPYLAEIVRRLGEAGSLVLAAEPGAGKTSLVPPAIADAIAATPDGSRSSAGKVLVMEPRRVAAVSAASRIAEVWGKKLGGDVGYRVRGDSSTGPRVRIEAVTPGVLIRMIQDDPGLEKVGCVVLDEFHERSAQADLALALLSQSRELRPGLRLLAMSATIDTAQAAAALKATVLDVPGRSFPIFTRYNPFLRGYIGDRPPNLGDRALNSELPNAIARFALDLLDETEGDVLVFLPGVAEIGHAASAFSALVREVCPSSVSRAEAAILHGSLPLEAQRRILSPPRDAPRRAIFATSIAETSLTVPRVCAVLDSGLARFSRFQPRTGLNRLVTEREAGDRADQRQGRAGRLGPGICLRAWPASETLSLRTEPELFRAELSGLVLEAALWGSPRRLDLPWLDPPPEGAWSAGTELLLELGALSPSLSPTALGRRMAALGTEPRLASLVLRGAEADEGWTACLAAAFLSDRGSSGLRDIAQSLEELGSSGAREGSSVLAEATRLARAAGLGAKGRPRPEALGPLLAAAFPDRIGERVEYRGANATFRIPAGRALRATGPLAQADWIVALEADAGAGASEGKIYSAYALGEEEAHAALERQATDALEVEWRGLEPKASYVKRAGAIVLGRRPTPRHSREVIGALLASRLASEGIGILPWDEGGAEELARLRYFTRARASAAASGGMDEASLSDGSLAARAADWLGPFVEPGGGPVIDGASLARAVANLAPRMLRGAIDREAPKRIELPSGSSRAIDYRGSGGPFVEARVHEFFGLSEHPRVCGEPLTLKLLDPGGKPLQVTSDLPGFWRGSWAEARKQLRGRYPKHEWPEDPAIAAPSRSGIKSRRARP